jgi:hypothetical protein
MSFDLGLEHESESASYIESAIEELEQTYHLVLLTDYFEESLILLKVSGPSSQTLRGCSRAFQQISILSFISQATFEL